MVKIKRAWQIKVKASEVNLRKQGTCIFKQAR